MEKWKDNQNEEMEIRNGLRGVSSQVLVQGKEMVPYWVLYVITSFHYLQQLSRQQNL